jgi:Holliday junction resolvasome RuvABC DNA-binding subunit
MGVNEYQILELKSRLQRLEIQKARHEERKLAAQLEIEQAKESLKALDFNPKTAREDIEHLYAECLSRVEDLEELLDLG